MFQTILQVLVLLLRRVKCGAQGLLLMYGLPIALFAGLLCGARLFQFGAQGLLAVLGNGLGTQGLVGLTLVGSQLCLPDGFTLPPILAIRCEYLAFGGVLGAQLIEQAHEAGFVGFTARLFGGQALLGLGALLFVIAAQLVQERIQLGKAGGGFLAYLGLLGGSGGGTLLGGGDGGFGGGAPFLFTQHIGLQFPCSVFGAFACLSLRLGLGDGLLFSLQRCGARLFGSSNRLFSGQALLDKGGFGLLHGYAPEGFQRRSHGLGNCWRQNRVG